MAPVSGNSEMRLNKAQFTQLSADLMNRGFVDTLPPQKECQAVRHEGFPVSRLSRRISGFELIVDFSMTLGAMQRLEGLAGNDYSVNARFEGLANRNIDMLLRCFRAKSHYRADSTYTATLVSSQDPGLLIREGLALEDALNIVRADKGMLDALDASEAADRLEGSLRELDNANRFRAAAISHMSAFIVQCRQLYESAISRVAGNPRIQAAMEGVAGRE